MRALVAVAGLCGLGAACFPGGLVLPGICHQDPVRTLPGLALCARCLGLYCGLGLAAALPLWRRSRWPLAAIVASAAALALGADSNPVRLALGLALGWTGASYLITLAVCPNTAPAAPNCRPMRASATNAAGRSGTSPS